MKSMKKMVLVGLVLLASVVGLLSLAGCKNDSVPEVPKYTVKFETEHGTAPASITVESGTKLTAEQLKALPDTDDNIFEGWYDGETQAKGGEYTVTKDVTLVAKWRNRDTVASVTFDPSSTKLYYGETVTVTLSTTTEGARIHYQLGEGEWKIYEKPFTVSSETVVTAYATKDGLKDSEKTKSNYLRQLLSITVTPPTRTVYSVGESFDSTGMVVTVTYDDGEPREVTNWTTDFAKVTSVKGVNKNVTVSYREGDVETTDTFTVDVASYQFTETVQDVDSSYTGTMSGGTYKKFGDWPQTIKATGVTVDKTKSRQMGMFTAYLGSDGNYYVEAEERAYGSGSEYKYSDGNSAGQDGTSEQWFKVEPIVWRVLTDNYLVPGENGTKIESGNALLLAENILTGGIPYYVDNSNRTIGSATVYANNYKYSTIRAWLNGSYETDDIQEKNYEGKGFLQTAFTAEAQKLIESTQVDNSAQSTNPNSNANQWNSGENPYACANTEDKIFLLSGQEATTEGYGFAAYYAYGQGNTRIRVTTDYAKATGAYQSGTAGDGGLWWLRSPGYSDEDGGRLISDGGNADYNYGFSVSSMKVGVVPALSISLQ